ncbi:PepSY-like domain-containing protein [Verrucomicrobiaceae bacterium 227]
MKKMTALTSFALFTLPAHADYKKRDIRLHDCPASVQKTISNHARGLRVKEVEYIRVEEQTVYIAEIRIEKGRDLEIFVNGQGALLKTSEELRIHELPQTVLSAARAMGGKIDDVEKVTRKGSVVTYEVEIDRKKGFKDLDVVFSPSGKVLQTREDD